MMEQSKSEVHIPNKRYFTIGEVSNICGLKTHVLRYWEQEFSELEPIKRKGNRRYYQQKDLILVLQIKDLLQNQSGIVQVTRKPLEISNEVDQSQVGIEAQLDLLQMKRNPGI